MTPDASPRWIRSLFLVAGAYDLLIGVAFLLAPRAIDGLARLDLPSQMGYVHLPAAFVLVFGIGLLLVARAPARNRDLVTVAILLKVAFTATVLYHLATGGVPGLFVPIAAADLAFAVAFVAARRQLPLAVA